MRSKKVPWVASPLLTIRGSASSPSRRHAGMDGEWRVSRRVDLKETHWGGGGEGGKMGENGSAVLKMATGRPFPTMPHDSPPRPYGVDASFCEPECRRQIAVTACCRRREPHHQRGAVLESGTQGWGASSPLQSVLKNLYFPGKSRWFLVGWMWLHVWWRTHLLFPFFLHDEKLGKKKCCRSTVRRLRCEICSQIDNR